MLHVCTFCLLISEKKSFCILLIIAKLVIVPQYKDKNNSFCTTNFSSFGACGDFYRCDLSIQKITSWIKREGEKYISIYLLIIFLALFIHSYHLLNSFISSFDGIINTCRFSLLYFLSGEGGLHPFWIVYLWKMNINNIAPPKETRAACLEGIWIKCNIYLLMTRL